MTGKQILKEVAERHNLQVSDLLGPVRLAQFVQARREAMVLMRARGLSSSQIGRIVNRDHTTVIHHTTDGMRERKALRMAKRRADARAALQ